MKTGMLAAGGYTAARRALRLLEKGGIPARILRGTSRQGCTWFVEPVFPRDRRQAAALLRRAGLLQPSGEKRRGDLP